MSPADHDPHDDQHDDPHDEHDVPLADLRARLARAAEGVQAPGDPVGRVRAEVGRRRHRRTQVRLAAASAAAAVVLVAAVVLTPGQLVRDAAPPAAPPSESTGPGDEVGVLLSPDGFPGLELGSEPDLDDLQETQLRPTGSGCVAIDTFLTGLEQLHPEGMTGTGLTVWLRDGVVVSLVALALPGRVQVPGDVPRTWVGPTLRSPVATALEVPGARLVKDRPVGDAGPEVNDVVIDSGDGAELVLSDVPLVEGTPTPGRITAMVLRSEAGRDCQVVAGENFSVAGQGLPDGPPTAQLDARGTQDVRLGGSVQAAATDGLLVPPPQDFGDPLDSRGCTSWDGAGTAEGLGVWSDGDRIVAVGALGQPFQLLVDPAISSADSVEDVRARPGAVVVAAPRPVPGTAVDLQLEPGVRARVVSNPVEVPATATGVVVRGDDVVTGVLLYEGDEPLDSLCSS